MEQQIKSLILKYEEELIKQRRYLHNHPELSGQEIQTANYLKKQLAKYHLPLIEVPNSTGFILVLETGKPGKTIGLRTDIDALPVQETESNLTNKRTCVSTVPGVMHACGHDGHMATLLTVIEILMEIKDQLTGKLIFIFEEGEETHSGILPMVETLKQFQFDAVYGAHLLATLPTGQVGLNSGSVMSGLARIEFEVLGQGGHGSRPDLSINPIFATANILTNLASAWINRLPVDKTVTLGLTQIQGGEALNVFPEKVKVGGTLRFFDETAGAKALTVFKQVTALIAQAHLAKVNFLPSTELALHPVNNDASLNDIAKLGLCLFPELVNQPETKWYASETFAHYQELAPTFFALVGAGNKSFGSGAEHHNQYFDLDEASLKYNVGLMLMFVLNFQGC